MNRRERKLLKMAIGEVEPQLTIRSDTRIDTGRWWWSSPIWVCVTNEEIILMAAARRQFLQKIPLSECRSSQYCHSTGELVFETGHHLPFKRCAMSPVNALRVLKMIDTDQEKDRTNRSTRPDVTPHQRKPSDA